SAGIRGATRLAPGGLPSCCGQCIAAPSCHPRPGSDWMTVDHAAPRRQLRSELRQRRRALPAAERIAAADHLASNLLALPFMPSEGHVAGYWAMDGEIALHAWQLKLPPGCTYCLPVLAGEQLRFAPWRPGDALVSNIYGIPEPDLAPGSLLDPQQMELVVLPLVGFDGHGARLG